MCVLCVLCVVVFDCVLLDSCLLLGLFWDLMLEDSSCVWLFVCVYVVSFMLDVLMLCLFVVVVALVVFLLCIRDCEFVQLMCDLRVMCFCV